jgi:hypothetical protein
MFSCSLVCGSVYCRFAQIEQRLLLASNSYLEGSKLVDQHPNVQYRVIDMKEEESYTQLISDADLVIRSEHSLLLTNPLTAFQPATCCIPRYRCSALYQAQEAHGHCVVYLKRDASLARKVGRIPP